MSHIAISEARFTIFYGENQWIIFAADHPASQAQS